MRLLGGRLLCEDFVAAAESTVVVSEAMPGLETIVFPFISFSSNFSIISLALRDCSGDALEENSGRGCDGGTRTLPKVKNGNWFGMKELLSSLKCGANLQSVFVLPNMVRSVVTRVIPRMTPTKVRLRKKKRIPEIPIARGFA